MPTSPLATRLAKLQIFGGWVGGGGDDDVDR